VSEHCRKHYVLDVIKIKIAMNPKADWYFDKDTAWQKEYRQLRKIVLDCGLNEEIKWGCPCYTLGNRNIVLIHGFKEYCALLFFKGALLADTNNILIQQTANVQSARQVRFTGLKEIVKLEPTLKTYIYEAISVEKAGLKVDMKKTEEFPVPEEFQKRLNEDAALKAAFEGLTPGRQRAYLFHFSQPKQAKTRESRIEKSVPQILEGRGLND
jgi:uncharacterized protein YdeI (YjbR/CyaY-like superfamily)